MDTVVKNVIEYRFKQHLVAHCVCLSVLSFTGASEMPVTVSLKYALCNVHTGQFVEFVGRQISLTKILSADKSALAVAAFL